MPKQEYVSSVSLMILGADLDPARVSKLLRLRPTQSWRKGDKASPDHEHRWGGWKKLSPAVLNSRELEAQLGYWCRLLKGKAAAIGSLSKANNSCVLRCFVTTDETASIIIGVQLQRSIAKLGLVMEIAMSVNPHAKDR